MMRTPGLLLFAIAILAATGCGGSGSGGNGGGGGGGGQQSTTPTLIAIAPSTAVVGATPVYLVAYGSNFQQGVSIDWNGKSLDSTCVGTDMAQTACSSAAAVAATIPAANLATAGAATITLVNPAVGSTGGTSGQLKFTITAAPAATTWVRNVGGISTPNHIVWDAARARLYVSLNANDAANPNTIAVVDPLAGTATSFMPAGSNPNLLSISSDGAYLWTGLDGDSSVQRFLLPEMTADISFPLPQDFNGNTQQALSLEAAPVSANTVALVAGHLQSSNPGDGVYVYDDSTARANHTPGITASSPGPGIQWIQWGKDDGTIYGTGFTTATVHVDSSGATLGSSGAIYAQPVIAQYVRSNGLLYSYGEAYDPVSLSLMGSFALTGDTCTADAGTGRYFCIAAYSLGGSDVAVYELWVFDLNSYALINRIFFGYSASTSGVPPSISGAPRWLVRWGSAGLALITTTQPGEGNGGLFLIDGAAINPIAAPDSASGTASSSYSWLSSITPDAATASSGEVQVTIKGTGFLPDSTACWNCNGGQLRLLPTEYVNSTQLNVTIPIGGVRTDQPLEVGVYAVSSGLFSSNALTFTVLPSSGSPRVMPVNLCGLSMAWDENSKLLYVGTADYDGSYPYSVVALDPGSGKVVKAQGIGSSSLFLTASANGQFLYAASGDTTNFTQLALPALNTTLTAPLKGAQNDIALIPGDLKAAPQDPHTVAATLIVPGYHPEALGGVVVFDDGIPRPNSLPGWTGGQTVPAIFDTLAWSASDQLLTSAPSAWDDGSTGPLYSLQVDSSGLSNVVAGTATFDTAGGFIHSDFGTGMIYSDGGMVADPSTQAIVGNYGASGLVAPDSTLNRVFILGQTAAQAATNNYTVQSFDEKAFTPVSSITLSNLSGTPFALVRWGSSGLAVLTTGGFDDVGVNGLGMLYLVQDASFVSGNARLPATEPAQERVKQRWQRMTARDILARAHQRLYPQKQSESR